MQVCYVVCSEFRLKGYRFVGSWYDKTTVGFHNFDLRMFNLRVSNPNKLVVDVFVLTRCRVSSMCQGLGPNEHDDISEIERVRCSVICISCYMLLLFALNIVRTSEILLNVVSYQSYIYIYIAHRQSYSCYQPAPCI